MKNAPQPRPANEDESQETTIWEIKKDFSDRKNKEQNGLVCLLFKE